MRPPTLLATLAVIASFIPLFFITGMMGPYMRPMALNVPVAMLMSLAIAFTVTPWVTYHALKSEYAGETQPYDFKGSFVYRFYGNLITPFLESPGRSYLFLGAVGGALVLSVLLVALKLVPLKMLPFDNKSELLVLVDMPEGTTLETTNRVAAELETYLAGVNEVRDVESFVGIASPMDFNGMVRHYYLRSGSHVADLRVNLLDKKRKEIPESWLGAQAPTGHGICPTSSAPMLRSLRSPGSAGAVHHRGGGLRSAGRNLRSVGRSGRQMSER